VRTAIDNVPRNITVDANVNPALQALNELNASLQTQIRAANDLNRALNQPVSAPSGGNGGNGSTEDPTPTFSEDIIDPREGLAAAQYARTVATTAAEMNDAVERLRFAQRALRGFSDGGFTGRGGMMQPAGVVHKGEYVVPQKICKPIYGFTGC